jgi:hypothetical protein
MSSSVDLHKVSTPQRKTLMSPNKPHECFLFIPGLRLLFLSAFRVMILRFGVAGWGLYQDNNVNNANVSLLNHLTHCPMLM